MAQFLSLSTENWNGYIIALALITSYFFYQRASKVRASFPPGPRGWTWPILGNILDFNTDQSRVHLQFSEWKSTYGDVVGLKVAGQSIIVLNSRSAVLELLGRRGAVYSDRPRIPFLRELMTGRTLLRFTLGNQTDQDREKIMEMADAFEEATALGTSVVGTHLVDLMPSLASLPLALFGSKTKSAVLHLRESAHNLLNNPYEMKQQDMENSVSSDPSMFRLLLEQNKQIDSSIKDEKSIKAVVIASYSAGVITGTETLKVFVLAMMRYPDVQQKAQALIDAVIGSRGLPALDDRSSLPYIEAILKETLRWKPVIPLAFPHRTTVDDVDKGYLIPKGSTIMPNSWQCLQDAGDYPDPENFLPERFCDSTGSILLNDAPEPRQFTFGYGRRVCPGRNFAENILWVNIATLLRTQDYLTHGRDYCFHKKLEPFECLFVPRSEDRLESALG
ncbi:cytochrome P450 [Armillaria borealis]|uniref:Cytochrome P450 n=1 Tax=Armillaria borealis TaxID=47425 RepID=A0AA39K492_9AGAR|nr:cytochrome P450 [Armillaria borealis]